MYMFLIALLLFIKNKIITKQKISKNKNNKNYYSYFYFEIICSILIKKLKNWILIGIQNMNI